MNNFIHLHNHTHYSLLDGLSSVTGVLSRAKELGMESLAITDHGNMYGAIDFYRAAQDIGIKPIIGCEVYVAENSITEKGEIFHLVLLSKNKEGYNNLMKLISLANIDGFYRKPRIDFEMLEKHHDGLICLSGCLSGELSHHMKSEDYTGAKKVAKKYLSLFEKDYYIEVQRHPNNTDQGMVTPQLIKLAKDLDIPMIATADTHYIKHEDNAIQDVLLAVQTGKKVSDTNRMCMMEDDFSLQTQDEMYELFKDIPEAVENSNLIAEQCNLALKFGEVHLPHFEIPEEETHDTILRKMCYERISDVYEEDNTEAKERLEYELEVIEKTGFAPYLLIVQDIIGWARKNGVGVGPGRGSAAGSIICYILGITRVDPLEYGLLFERFMNPERISMPDIDMDFDDERRDEVIDYVVQKYGKNNVAQIITFGTMGGRAAIRDAGRALSYPIETCDRVAKMVPQGMDIEEAINQHGPLFKEYETVDETRHLLDVAMRLEGVVRHASTHACGVVVAKNKITSYCPVQRSTHGEGVTTQYDMKAIEALGLLKMDFLGLKNLTIIKKAIEIINQRYNCTLDIDKIPFDDERTFRLFQNAQTSSVFQLESDGMKHYLKDLKPSSINDITAMVALYRPGPMELIPSYIDRKHGKEKIEYLHPSLEPILKDTYGIMIYQEQLMSAARVLSGISLAEADILRKAVGKKNEKLLKEQEAKLKEGAKRIGTPESVINKFWELVGPFSRYGFNKSHAVSYAFIAYETAFLKANYPLEFMAAVMNCDASDIERTSFLINEAKELGIKILPPDINTSGEMFTIDGHRIRFGLSVVKNVGGGIVSNVVIDRKMNGEFNGIEDFVLRVGKENVNKKTMESMIKAGAFGGNRNQLLENLDNIVAYAKGDKEDGMPPLVMFEIPDVPPIKKLAWEKELLGMYVSENPISRYAQDFKAHGVVPSTELYRYKDKFVRVGGMVVSMKKFTTKFGKPMMFVGVEDSYGRSDVIIFSGLYAKMEDKIKENSIVIVSGKGTDGKKGPGIICTDIQTLEIIE